MIRPVGSLQSRSLALPVGLGPVAVGSNPTPDQIADLALWLDASRISAAENDPIGTWSDLSGGGHHATQATTAAKPIYKGSALNGQPGLLFDGVDDYLDFGAANLFSAGLTLFVVYKSASATPVNRTFIEFKTATTQFIVLQQESTSPAAPYIAFRGQAAKGGSITYTTSPALFVVTWDGVSQSALGSFGCRHNGAVVSLSNLLAAGGTANVNEIGADGNHTGLFFSGHAGSILAYRRKLSATEIGSVESYLNGRYPTLF